MNFALQKIVLDVKNEVEHAESLHGPMHSYHEAYAVILEELDEFWEEVRKKEQYRNENAMRQELIQVAAMCVRTIYNLDL